MKMTWTGTQQYQQSEFAFRKETGDVTAESDSTKSISARNVRRDRLNEWSRLLVLTAIRFVYYWQERSIYLYRLLELIVIADLRGHSVSSSKQ